MVFLDPSLVGIEPVTGHQAHWSPNLATFVGFCQVYAQKEKKEHLVALQKRCPGFFLESIWWHEDSEIQIQRFISSAVETGYGNPKFAWHGMANPENIQ